MTILSIALIIVAALVLIKAVDWFIESSSQLAQHFGISSYTVSFFLVAAATSLPETVVGITSALERNPLLGYGTVIGSNIALLTLIISVPVLLSVGISTRTILRSKDMYITVVFALLPIALILDADLNITDGFILLAAYIIYTISVIRESTGLEKLLEEFTHVNYWKQCTIFIVSLLLLLGASEIMVKSALRLSFELGLTVTFVGLTITAIGTSLPEIAFAIGAIKGKHQQEILGNIIGSVVANSTLVLGLIAVIHPIVITPITPVKFIAIIFLVLSLILFVGFARSEEKISKFEALLLFLIYIVFLVMEYNYSNLR